MLGVKTSAERRREFIKQKKLTSDTSVEHWIYDLGECLHWYKP